MTSVDAHRIGYRDDPEPEPEYESGALEEIFGDNTKTRVLTFLAMNDDQPYPQKDIAKAIDISQAMVSRVSQDLRDSGLVQKAEGAGRRRNGLELAETHIGHHIKKIVDGDLPATE